MKKGRAFLAVAVLAVFLIGGCEKDPNDPQTWVDKLGDRQEQNDALRRLEHFADPATIKPLADAWKKQNKPSAILRVIIAIAQTKDAKTGKANYTPEAIATLKDAVENFDTASSRSIDD